MKNLFQSAVARCLRVPLPFARTLLLAAALLIMTLLCVYLTAAEAKAAPGDAHLVDESCHKSLARSAKLVTGCPLADRNGNVRKFQYHQHHLSGRLGHLHQ
jgi:hypothetical protein